MAESDQPGGTFLDVRLPGGWKGKVVCANLPPEKQSEVLDAWLTSLIHGSDGVPHARVLKTSPTVDVVQCDLPDELDLGSVQVVCKRFKPRGFKKGVAGSLRHTPAKRNFLRAQMLSDSRIATAAPLAYLESAHGSLLVTQYLSDLVDLDAYVMRGGPKGGVMAPRSRRATIAAIANLFVALKEKSLTHRDLKSSNIMLSHTNTGSPRASIVDLDGLFVRRFWHDKWKPIVRLAASLLQYPGVSRTDYARFLREYLCACGEHKKAWRAHIRRLARQANHYAISSRNRKSGKLDGYM